MHASCPIGQCVDVLLPDETLCACQLSHCLMRSCVYTCRLSHCLMCMAAVPLLDEILCAYQLSHFPMRYCVCLSAIPFLSCYFFSSPTPGSSVTLHPDVETLCAIVYSSVARHLPSMLRQWYLSVDRWTSSAVTG